MKISESQSNQTKLYFFRINGTCKYYSFRYLDNDEFISNGISRVVSRDKNNIQGQLNAIYELLRAITTRTQRVETT